MASTYTPLGVELQATGENAGTWGTKTNTNLQIIEQISGGFTEQSIAGGAQTTALSVSDGSTGATLSHRMIEFTGTISGNQIVTIPLDVQTFYFLRNSTSGSHTVQFKYVSGSGASVTFAADDKGDKIVFASASDSTNPIIKEIAMGDVTLTGTQTLTNKTLTSPKIGTALLDTNGNELAKVTATSSAVNEFTIANAATGNDPTLSATGGDSNIDIAIKPKGTGETVVGTGAANATITSSGAHNLILDTNSGTNSGVITIVDGANGNITITPNGSGNIVLDGLTFPNADGSSGQALQTNGSGTLSFATISGSSDFFFASKTSGQSIPNNTNTKVTFTSEDFDTGSDFASSTYTAPSDGKYFFYTKLLCDNSSGDTIKIFFFKNGSQFVETRNSSHGANRRTFQHSAILDLSADDTIEVYKFQDGGSARDVDGDSNRSTYFMGYKIA
jgi:hypothetical protein